MAWKAFLIKKIKNNKITYLRCDNMGIPEQIENHKVRRTFKLLSICFLIIQAGIIVISVVLIRNYKTNDIKADKDAGRKIPVHVNIVKPLKVADVLQLPGHIESWVTVKISAELEGRIVYIGAEKGQKIEKGQLLLKLDDRTYAAQKKRYETEFCRANLNYERNKKLFDSKSVSERDWEEALCAKDRTEAELAIARANLDKTEVQSPISGYLDERPVELGEYMQPGTHLVTVVQVDKVKLSFSIPERDIADIRSDDVFEFTIDCCSGKIFKGKVIYIATAADKASLSFPIELEVPNPDMALRPGMIARVKVVKKIIEKALAVPLIAVIPQYGEHYVFLADENDCAVMRKIRIDFINGKNAVISEGVKDGDRVIVEGQRLLKENDALNIISQEIL